MHRRIDDDDDEQETTIDEPAPQYENPDDDEFMFIEDGQPVPKGWVIVE